MSFVPRPASRGREISRTDTPRPRASPREWLAVAGSSMRAVASLAAGSSRRAMIRARMRSRRRCGARGTGRQVQFGARGQRGTGHAAGAHPETAVPATFVAAQRALVWTFSSGQAERLASVRDLTLPSCGSFHAGGWRAERAWGRGDERGPQIRPVVTCQAQNAILHDYVLEQRRITSNSWTKRGAKFGLGHDPPLRPYPQPCSRASHSSAGGSKFQKPLYVNRAEPLKCRDSLSTW